MATGHISLRFHTPITKTCVPSRAVQFAKLARLSATSLEGLAGMLKKSAKSLFPTATTTVSYCLAARKGQARGISCRSLSERRFGTSIAKSRNICLVSNVWYLNLR